MWFIVKFDAIRIITKRPRILIGIEGNLWGENVIRTTTTGFILEIDEYRGTWTIIIVERKNIFLIGLNGLINVGTCL